MAAKSAYENEAYVKETVEKHWKNRLPDFVDGVLGFFNCWNDYEEDYTTQGFMWSGNYGNIELIGVSFRGTSPFNAKDWSSDVDLSWYELPGAALSVIFPAILAHHNETKLLSKLEGVYTFGQPRVGDNKFGEYMKEVLVTHDLRYHRFVYCNDLVPRVPFDSSDLYFKHFGDCHYYNSFYKGQMGMEKHVTSSCKGSARAAVERSAMYKRD
ncbi:hypothetical protein L1987_66087 [Smallanthus sonchifolius]|uniref:Uncharacterized protein n=1 Tax=Smallanthus sonchifolius TaxID=185202 RepID=A0ACB9BWB5_9ASTR|nr:hypothetical protein L1987_66087 [Smallanthus sonchifolius]